MNKIVNYTLLFAVSFFSANVQAVGLDKKLENSLVISDGWIRLMPAVATTSAAYFTLYNRSDKAIKLVKITSDIAKKATMHDMVMEQEMTGMVAIKQLVIPAGKTVVFSPGGKHLMLIGLTEKLELNKDITINFELESGEIIKVILQSYRNPPKPSLPCKDS